MNGNIDTVHNEGSYNCLIYLLKAMKAKGYEVTAIYFGSK